jgi:hypothetical protein
LERTCLMEPLPAEESAFAARRDAARGRILLVAQEILRLVGTVLAEHAAVTKKLCRDAEGLSPGCGRHRRPTRRTDAEEDSSSPRPSSACSTTRATSRPSPCAWTRRATTRRATRG